MSSVFHGTLKPALWLFAFTIIAASPPQQVRAADVRVVDGDTLVLNGERVRLEGIDAPELAQTCLTSSGNTYRCGVAAKEHLQALTRAGEVTCTGAETDAYDRRLATCFSAGQNLNKAMVADGQAYAFLRYSDAYRTEQEMARLNGNGLWAGIAVAPWDFRQQKWQIAGTRAPEGCPIKGNISANGRIYHTPWSPHYARTRINEAAGERWFCSEDEAEAAGWRPPLS
ncbi:thermonuclease family protein [Roseibium sp.]|uniref:thermonuclease family protein n=1 Tax=Roseibium sp. TaxID=1936156 RepID=UPI003B52B376